MLRYKTKTRPGLVALYETETERVHSYNPGARTGPPNINCTIKTRVHTCKTGAHENRMERRITYWHGTGIFHTQSILTTIFQVNLG